ncbi:enoyl-CoA hydratase/carnithine racemase-like protein [Glaesserella parasuis ZJ0906]|uniref:Enoyl-CoA hydratase/carnithine racemase-like protein n=1 Tax=Glaesserella parasuis ZJ0906 TaxID=1322346 RepID=A0A806J5V3_GLAPU|nr:enoyl-CoA hydratase/carnithine racemase-like protein [Glaesserella parasuis ZJ0906]AGO17019.1 enoyl-CoA hydratase/carnithine racemase-like protein [Glaesserella parasuis ZJ0906]MDD2164834.1 enoyl-CoA hydratase [Glaesserella parasuis]MDP0380089.1 enoyl-CoA hydratase [Glaesserella parasuis]MDP0402643.1 enoyl-CoA hydratase [Glaesserella parasuis]
MNKIYLALYKGNAKNWRERLEDWLIRKATKGQYSHCEIAIHRSRIYDHYHQEEWFECYSSSLRDGGVRCKIINVSDRSKWDLVELPNVTEAQIRFYFEITKGKKYDLWGALGVVLGFKQRGERFFCSEWCFNAIFNSEQGWRFSPNQLAVILNKKEMLR